MDIRAGVILDLIQLRERLEQSIAAVDAIMFDEENGKPKPHVPYAAMTFRCNEAAARARVLTDKIRRLDRRSAQVKHEN